MLHPCDQCRWTIEQVVESKIFHTLISVAQWYQLYRDTLIHLDTSWYVLGNLDTSWYVLGNLDTSWYILIHLDMFWEILGHFNNHIRCQ
jgi:hypothetical protein